MPPFLISAQLGTDPSLTLTLNALHEGYSLLINPILEYGHTSRYIGLHMLFTLPVLKDKTSICTVEYLTPLKYNISGTCYSGPLTRNELSLVTYTNSKTVIMADTISKCYKEESTILCSANVLTLARTVEWLGLNWVPDTRLQFPRNHQKTTCPAGIPPLLHLGGSYYLATGTASFALTNATINLTPLGIYHLPCGEPALAGLATGLGPCPNVLTIPLPLFTTDIVHYVPYTPETASDTLKAHYQSLAIPPPLVFNK